MSARYFFLSVIFTLLLHNWGYTQYNKDSLLKIVRENKADTGTAQALILFGEMMEANFPDSALQLYNKSARLLEKVHNTSVTMLLYNAKIHYFIRKELHDSALAITNQFLKEAEASKNKHFIAKANAAAGTLYGAVNQIDLSLDYYLRATQLFTELRDTISLGQLYGNISTVYADQDQYQKSIEYATKSVILASERRDTFDLVKLYTNMHHAWGFLDSSSLEEKFLRLSVALSEKSSHSYLLIKAYGYFAHWLAENEKYDSCMLYATKVYDMAREHDLLSDQSDAKAMEAWALIGKKEYDKATLAMAEAKELVKNKKNTPPLHLLYLLDIEYDLLYAQKKYKEALAVKEQWIQLNGRVMNERTSAKMVFYNNRVYQVEVEKKMTEKQLKINQQKNLIALLSVGFAAFALIGLLFYLYQRKKEALKTNQIAILQKEKEFISVRSSLEAQLRERGRISQEIHDELGASLTSISLLTEVLKKKMNTAEHPEINKISGTSAEMVDKMNEIIWSLNAGNDTIDSLVAYIRKFANNFLHDAGITLDFSETGIPKNQPLEGTVRRNIYLAVKEAINNIVKHSQAKKVTIVIDASSGLQIEIKDNGRGLDTTTSNGLGNGLKNMKKRMEDIGGSFTIESNNGTLIKLSY